MSNNTLHGKQICFHADALESTLRLTSAERTALRAVAFGEEGATIEIRLIAPLIHTLLSKSHMLFAQGNEQERLHRAELLGIRKSRLANRGYLLVAVCMLLVASFSSREIVIESDSERVTYVSKSWWGFVRAEREIRWMRTDDRGYFWMARDRIGKWEPYLVEYD